MKPHTCLRMVTEELKISPPQKGDEINSPAEDDEINLPSSDSMGRKQEELETSY